MKNKEYARKQEKIKINSKRYTNPIFVQNTHKNLPNKQ